MNVALWTLLALVVAGGASILGYSIFLNSRFADGDEQ
ncbi:hypothetical protein ABIA96_006592 [Bradyrhizobium sp. LB11.1]|jgi:hypothetical protein